MPEELEPEYWWPDHEFVPYLEAEQKLYAWVLSNVGGIDPTEAMIRALSRFHYESMQDRGVMTNQGAWRIAMKDLFGTHLHDPEEFGLKEKYEAERMRLFHGE